MERARIVAAVKGSPARASAATDRRVVLSQPLWQRLEARREPLPMGRRLVPGQRGADRHAAWMPAASRAHGSRRRH